MKDRLISLLLELLGQNNVDGVLSAFKKAVDRLEAIEKRMESDIEKHNAAITKSLQKIDRSNLEQQRAAAARERVAALIGQ